MQGTFALGDGGGDGGKNEFGSRRSGTSVKNFAELFKFPIRTFTFNSRYQAKGNSL
jgi:hypothetical protein